VELLPLSFLAGVLTVLSPCVLPLLPVILAGSAAESRRKDVAIIIGALAVSVVAFTLLIRGTTALLGVPSDVWLIVSGSLIVFIGLSLVFPAVWDRISAGSGLQRASGELAQAASRGTGTLRNVLLGLSVGPIFTSCSPTYGLILATVLPTSLPVGLANLLAYTVGLSAVMMLVAMSGQTVITRMKWAANPTGAFRRGLGAVLIVAGLLIATGVIKDVETWLVDRGILGAVLLEQEFLDRGGVDRGPTVPERLDSESTGVPPAFLVNGFSHIDWRAADPAVFAAVSGGPPPDGIPALDDPTFVPLSDVTWGDGVDAIVLDDGSGPARVYPYNVLVWHEIVNDTVDGVPVAVTFCPLCGSAIVFERTLPNGEPTTFGVSGGLIESNMIMFDRETKGLWQQSTGRSLAGEFVGTELALRPFQLLTLGEVRARHPDALVLSADTGYTRDYERNPYGDYEVNDQFLFAPSTLDERYPPKLIMAAFLVNGERVAIPWLALREAGELIAEVAGDEVTARAVGGELEVLDADGRVVPFYFEMWFSWAAQNGGSGIVIDPNS
jgi:cytochrome c biogenesis protein CcdA